MDRKLHIPSTYRPSASLPVGKSGVTGFTRGGGGSVRVLEDMATKENITNLDLLQHHKHEDANIEDCCLTLAGVILDLRRRVTDLKAVLAEQFEKHSDVSSIPCYVWA